MDRKSTIGRGILNILVMGIPYVISLGIAFWLKVLAYWLPASFIILIVWVSSDFLKKRFLFSAEAFRKRMVKTVEVMKLRPEQFGYLRQILFKNASSGTNAVGAIFFFNMVAILLIWMGFIKTNTAVSLLFPFILSVVFVASSLAFVVIGKIAPSKLEKSLQSPKMSRKYAMMLGQKYRKRFSVAYAIGFIVVFGVYFYTLFTILPLVEDYSWLALILALQFLSFEFAKSYFGGENIKNEINKSIVVLNHLRGEIEKTIEKKKVTKEEVKQLKIRRLEAKKFSNFISDDLKIIKFHSIVADRQYFDYLRRQ
jgi:hypothetical protein